MPAVVSLGFQAVILCGTGASLYPFTQAEDMPKALLPLANRPMIYYSLDWCEKAGVQSILILTLQEHQQQIQSHFKSPAFTSTSLSHILAKRGVTIQFEAPSSLNDNLQSADILRVAKNKGWIKGDFVVLPCDIVAQGLGLQQIVQVWMVEQGAFGGGGSTSRNGEDGRDGRRGPLGVWYGVGGDGAVKGQESDLLIISPKSTLGTQSLNNGLPGTPSSSTIHSLLQTFPPHALKGVIDSSDLPFRYSLLERHPRAQLRCHSHRDAHIYILPHWVLDFIVANPKLSSLKDDVIPWLAKCSWQKGLGERMGLEEILSKRPRSAGNDGGDTVDDGEEEFDVGGRSTTQVTNPQSYSKFLAGAPPGTPPHSGGVRLAQRAGGGTLYNKNESHDNTGASSPTSPPASMSMSLQSLPGLMRNPIPLIKRVPKVTAYLTAADYSPTVQPAMPYIRRVDTPHLFLTANLHLAKSEVPLPGQPATSANTNESEQPATQTAHVKIDPTCNVSPRATVTSSDTILGPNCTIMEKAVIKRCVLGPNVTVQAGARLMGCVLLEGCVVEGNVKLDGCILGKGARVGTGSILKDCEVSHGYVVEEGTEAKGERLVTLEGMEEGGEGGSGWGSDEVDEDDGDYTDSDDDDDDDGNEDEQEEDEDEDGEEGVQVGEDEEDEEEGQQHHSQKGKQAKAEKHSESVVGVAVAAASPVEALKKKNVSTASVHKTTLPLSSPPPASSKQQQQQQQQQTQTQPPPPPPHTATPTPPSEVSTGSKVAQPKGAN
ncbi:hypothetical protein DFH27DRAFT_597293 [Peziza echinospora]|nr:hypothetical protein DFH27DRAFT_597293 [Peziza echinospora]